MNILTFDIEDWFHINFNKEFNNESSWVKFESRVEYNTDLILNILSEQGITATFFCLGWIARKYPSLLKRIQSNGHDIACHSDIHNLVNIQTPEEFRNDLVSALNSIEFVTGEKVKIYRAPAFSIGKKNTWAFDILIDEGIHIDCSIFPSSHDFGGFKNLNIKKPFKVKRPFGEIKEYPMSTFNLLGKKLVLAGGGYFRFFPYPIINWHLKCNKYNMTYFHPRDIDKDQPLLEGLSKIRRFKSYYGLNQSKEKFTRLISNFDFVSITEAEKLYDWENAKALEI